MCTLKKIITIENIINEFNLTVDSHQSKPNEYTIYSTIARFDTASPSNAGKAQAYFYRAMTAKEFEAFRFGTVIAAGGHQGFASYRNYSKGYINKMFDGNNYAVLIEVYAPNWIGELNAHGWSSGKAESGDMSWGIGTTQSNGWSNTGTTKYSNKNLARTPLSIFQATTRMFRVVNLIIKTKTKKDALLAPPSDAPWYGIFSTIEAEKLSADEIALLKKSSGFAADLPRLPTSQSIDENGIPTDGNCLFHSLAKNLRERGIKQLTHEHLRTYVCLYMSNHQDFCDTWGITPQYIENMKLPGTWGGGIEIAIIATIYSVKINILVITQGFSSTIAFNTTSETAPIQIEYRNGNHYTTR
jgi:hypothetical protein